jgi:uncharacterized membrane protein YhaH (DUF805 family)
MELLAVMRSPYHPLTLFAFTGRIGRLQYLAGYFYLSAIALIVGFAGGVVALLVGDHTVGDLAAAVVTFAVLVPALGLMVQRMRDFGRKWWWLLVIYGGLFVSMFLSRVLTYYVIPAFDYSPMFVFEIISMMFMIITWISLAGTIGLSFALFFVPSKPEVMLDGEPVEPREPTFAGRYFQPRVGEGR